MLIAFSGVVPARADQKPLVNISYPADGSLIRANVPVFGTAYIPGDQGKFKQWYLEFGAGRSPSLWTRIKQSEQPESYDPYGNGKVVWNLNKEPAGNLTNWAVGLASYNYANWGKNLNGIYTLRLVAETDAGEKSETRRAYYVGEAIIRLYGGTGISSDLKCRLSVPSFAFGGEQARVVAVVKQMPSTDFAKCKTVTGVEETDKSAAEIYTSVPSDFQLQSAIYRIYPAGLKTDPSSSLQIDFDPQEFSLINAHPAPAESGTLYQWDPVTRLWSPLKTEWYGNTAKAEVHSLPDYFSYVALMTRVRPVSATSISWQEISALSGYWVGKTNPSTAVSVISRDGRTAKCESDTSGNFRLPFRLNPGSNPYRIELTPLEGKAFARSVDLLQKSGEVVTSLSPSLRILGDSTVSVKNKLVILCQDTSLSDANVKARRSIVAQVQTSDFSKRFTVELAETVAGMGNFIGCILPQGSQDTQQSTVASYFPSHLAEGDKLNISVGSAMLNMRMKDTEPPKISLSSVTHPCMLFANPQGESALASSQLHSQCNVTIANNAWKLAGVEGDRPSARIANWNAPAFQIASWPFIGFTYKLYHQAPWQLILRGDKGIQSFHFACEGAYFEPYAFTDPLIADGNWHDWQRSLTEGKFKQIDSVSFGSWIKTGYLRVEPGFPDASRDTILVKDLWIGRSYTDRLVEMEWHIEDDSPLGRLDWWVDQQVDSPGPEAKAPLKSLSESMTTPIQPDGKCVFKLLDDGKWFFHIRAVDLAGNASPVISYPLIVYSTLGKNEAAADRLLNVAATQDVSWNQPDGTFQVKLQGFGASLNPSSLSLRIGSVSYRMAKVNWNSSSEALTIGATSFGNSIPLGFDKETLSAKIEGLDMTGKPILNLPDLKIHITSQFSWSQTDGVGLLKPASYNPDNQWIAFWKNPIPPWMSFFPNCVNNVLVLTTGRSKQQPSPLHWERPMAFASDDTQNVLWEENWTDPTSKPVPVGKTLDKLIFSFNGTPATIPGRFAPRDLDKNAWVYMQTPTDPFEPATLRMISRPKEGEMVMSRASAADVIGEINRQGRNIIRLDGWISQSGGFIYLRAPGKRKIQFATGSDSSYRFLPGQEIRIDAAEEWTRFTILITPAHDYKTTGGGAAQGKFYW